MKIKISTALPDALNRDTLILGFFSDERPPRGYCGLVDWRLNGMISTEIARGRVSGNFMEKLLYAFPKRIRISRILLFGLGAFSELTYDRLYNTGYEMARTVSGIQADDLALPIPAADRGLKLSAMAEALITGIYDGFSSKPEELLSIRLEIPAKADHTDEIRAGLDLFRQRVGAAECEILPPGDQENSPGGMISQGGGGIH
jgi:hypothetical protein